MPPVTVSRKQLRRDLGTRRLRETTLGTTSYSPMGAAGSAMIVMDRTLARPDFSGDSQYQRAWIRVGTGDYQVASFNFGSGAAFANQILTATAASGMDFEIHEKLSPAEMDAAIDETITGMRLRQEIALPSLQDSLIYPLNPAASPSSVVRVLDTYYFADPTSTSNRQRREFLPAPEVVLTPTGPELRLQTGIVASLQIVLDALVEVSLAAGDAATVSVEDEETILWGAAARCYDLMIQRSPGQEATLLEKRRKEAAMMFFRKAQSVVPDRSADLGFEPVNSGSKLGTSRDYWRYW